MRTVRHHIAIMAACGMLAGCTVAFQTSRDRLIKTATLEDYGPRPAADHRAVERIYIEAWLRDPESAEFRFGELQPGIMPSATWSPRAILVWVSWITVNARNGFGGYTGFQQWAIAWRDGEMVAVWTPRQHGWEYFKRSAI